MQEDRDPRDYGARCKRCPFAYRGEPNLPVFGEGPLDALGVLVGEGPGRDEQEHRRPFVGATGRELDDALVRAKLPRARLFVVNAMCCRPTVNKTDGMMRNATERCRPVLLYQLGQLTSTPHFFAMGKWAMFALTGHATKLDNWRGFLQNFDLRTTHGLLETWLEKRLQKRARETKAKAKRAHLRKTS